MERKEKEIKEGKTKEKSKKVWIILILLLIIICVAVASLAIFMMHKGNDSDVNNEVINDEILLDNSSSTEANEIETDEKENSNNSSSKISSRYEIISERNLTWEEAKEKCEEAGGHLVTITSQEEMDYIYRTLDIENGRYWIGAYRDDDFNWMWVTGEEWNYTNWNAGEPNDSSNVKSNENRAVTWSQGKWNDLNEENTGEQYGYICEWE